VPAGHQEKHGGFLSHGGTPSYHPLKIGFAWIFIKKYFEINPSAIGVPP
jgi:hypothetical protein